jgi:hypothetical protein
MGALYQSAFDSKVERMMSTNESTAFDSDWLFLLQTSSRVGLEGSWR